MWPFSTAPKIYTGRVLTAAEVRAALGSSTVTLGKLFYAEVNSAAVVWLAQRARDALWSDGINRWRPDATCTLFAAKFAVNSGELFFEAAFQDEISNQILALAAGECWFTPDNSPGGQGHAIGVAITEKGALYIDPQAPDALRLLSATELLTRYHLRFL